MKVGLVGYSKQKFDSRAAWDYIHEAFDVVRQVCESDNYTLVSGLTNIGIPALGYAIADLAGWRLIGVACAKAKDYDCYPVHQEIIVGENWGDESTTFINMLDVLIRIGGGEQSKREVAMARALDIMVIEYELEALDE